MEERTQKVLQTVCVHDAARRRASVRPDDHDRELHGQRLHEWKRSENYTVQVCSYKTEQRTDKVQYTMCKTVAEEVTERVPVTTCVAAARRARAALSPKAAAKWLLCVRIASTAARCGGRRHRHGRR